MKDEGAASWSMERAKAKDPQIVLKPVPSQLVFKDKPNQIIYCKQKLRNIERLDAAKMNSSDNN